MMEKFEYIFRNNGVSDTNDDVIDFRTFDLSKEKFSITITPTKSTKFWRVGFAFSKIRSFDFEPAIGRYRNRDLKYVEINVGERINDKWVSDDKISLGSYYIDGFNGAKGHQGYKTGSPVSMTIKPDSENKVFVSIYTDKLSTSDSFPILDYKYFKIFAWADGLSFEIKCDLEIESLSPVKGVTIFVERAASFSLADDFAPSIQVNELSKEVADLLRSFRDEKGNMFGIFGKWGRGKTFFWKQLWNELESSQEKEDIKFIKVEFHAWKYQDTPAVWAYLYETFADCFFKAQRASHFFHENAKSKSRGFNLFRSIKSFGLDFWYTTLDSISTFVKRIRLNAVRIGYRPVFYFFLGLLLFIYWLFLPISKKFKIGLYLVSVFGLIGFIKIIYLYFVYKAKARNIFSKYSEKISFQEQLGLQAEIQKEMISLLSCWIPDKKIGHQKIVLFVDDIDRCNEERIMQVVDSLKVMLESESIAKRLIILTAIDDRVLRMAIRLKYHDLTTGSKEANEFLKTFTREYCDKLFIGGIKLGELSIDERLAIFGTITSEKIEMPKIIPEDIDKAGEAPSFLRRNELREPQYLWANETIDSSSFETVEANEGFEIGYIEYEMLRNFISKFTESTPRSIRIFYYRYLLAKRIMKYKFKKGSRIYNLWNSPVGNKYLLPSLILHYSKSMEEKELENEFEFLDNYSEGQITKQLDGREFNLDVQLYKELLKVVEIVVPY